MKKFYQIRSVHTEKFTNVVKLIIFLLVTFSFPAFSQPNDIVVENALPGNPSTEWDITGRGDLNLQGFATEISVNKGGTVSFKIKSDAAYTVDIYRLGWYGGNGARKVSTANPVLFDATLPQVQPADLYYPETGMTDCSNWALSAHWVVPANAVSGIYIAKLTRIVGQGASHIIFIVRDDDANSDILFKTADGTWQAYNRYGGNNFYYESETTPVTNFAHAVKASYNRPFQTRNENDWGGGAGNWIFNAEYPMLRWLERNGYDVTYTTHVDMSRNLQNITTTNHRILMSVGHDEYWSDIARTNFETARNNGVHLAFFSGNEVYWKTRWEYDPVLGFPILVCYKEGNMGENFCGYKCDPEPVWTGLWRAPALAPLTDPGRPENALSGQISWYLHTGPIEVPSEYKNMRFWRNTAVASLADGTSLTLPTGTLGYEMDWEQYFDYYPAGRITMSSTLVDGVTHKLSLYRHSSGALVFGAGTIQWAWGLDDMHDNVGFTANEASSPAMQQATLNLLADMDVQPGSIQAGLQAAAASTDMTPPSSAIVYPTEGSTVPNSTFAITGTAQDVDGVVAGVEVSVDGGLTWQMATGRETWSFSWTPGSQHAITIMSRAFDDSGNIEALSTADNTRNVTVSPPDCPCTIWEPAVVPGNDSDPDATAVEVGVRFRSNTDGYITGIRFYKGPLNTGTHIGNLWSEGGGVTPLASAVFTNETATGWQEVTFSSPVAITANTNYIASYHTTSGHYAFTENYFAASGHSSYYLTALESTVSAPNGLFSYLPSSTFPTQSYNASNYWVDVVFSAAMPDDVTPPVVASVIPVNGASGILPAVHPSALFSEELNPLTVTTASVLMTGPGDVPVSGTVSYTRRRVTFVPDVPLTYHATYRMILVGGTGSDAISDLAGNKLAVSYEWSFKAAAPPPPPPDQGQGGPILVISSTANPFSRYYVEILRAEGLNGFYALDVADVTPAVLASYDVAILGDFAITDQFAADLTTWVEGGGTLVAMRPDTRLNGLLGINRQGGTLADRYLLVNTSEGPGVGIVDETIQFHSIADLYSLNGAISIATLYSDAFTPTANPAVTIREVGSNGGKAVAFAYDLARSIVYTRQGNPAWAGQKRDGTVGPVRSDDMFFPDWVDLNKVDIPQADEQQRFLANIIIKGALHKKPMPRFWFLPKGLKAALIMTGDNHSDIGMRSRFDYEISISPTGCSPEDWECIRSTAYFYVGSTVTNAEAEYYTGEGFELALHVNTNCLGYTPQEFQSFITDQLGSFTSSFPGIPVPTSNRNHCIAWPDWSTAAEVEAANGMRLDVNYYYWPNTWHGNRPGLFTGSGSPMRFAKTDGSLIDVYQATTQMQDEMESIPLTPYPEFFNALLDKALGPEGYYGAFCANMHFDNPDNQSATAITLAAMSRGVPVITARQMLEWLDGRNSSRFGTITWVNNTTLSFAVTTGDGANNLRGMLPALSETGEITGLTRDGSPVSLTREVIKGIEYAFFPTVDGAYVATYSVGNATPVVVVHPQNVTTCEGSSATFTSSAEGIPVPAVSWEESPDGNSWTPVPDVATGTLTVIATTANHNHRYRAVWGNAAGVVTSNTATLTVNAPLTATIDVADNYICEGESVQLRLSASNGQAPWFPEVGGVTYRADNIGDVFATLPLQGYSPSVTYELTRIADGSGCSSAGVISSTTVTVERKPAGTIAPLQSPVYEGEEMNLVFTSTAGTGPFTLTVNGINHTGISSGGSFLVGTAVYAPTPVAQTIWPLNTVPGTQTIDQSSIELGIEFRTTEPGTISAIRFYKADLEVRNFTVSLWNVSTGSRIAGPVNYTSDVNPGWKQIELGTPVSINANTAYIASYFSPAGNYYAYTATSGFPLVSGPLRAERGLFSVSTATIPDQGRGANYWVDVVFNSTAGVEGVTSFNLTSITSEAECSATGNPISSTNINVTQARVWTGATDSDWGTTGNWSDGVVPAVAENVVIPVVASNNYPVISGLVTTNALIVRPLASVTVNAGGALTVNGELNTTEGTLTINSASTASSGSLIVNGTSTGNVTYNRFLRPDAVEETFEDRHFFSSPVGGQGVQAFLDANPGKINLGSTGYEIREWNEALLSANWQIVSPAVSFGSGRGYRVNQADGSDGLLKFTGTVVNSATVKATSPYANYNNNPRSTRADYGDPTFSPSPLIWAPGRSWDDYGGGGWNLMGNPFTSAMNAATFVSVNTGKFDPNYQALYVYDGNSATPQYLYAGAATPVPAYDNGGWFSENIQAGQGFLVLALYNDIDFNFTPAMQVHNTGLTLLKSAKTESDPWQGLQLKVTYGDKERATVIVYNSEMTTGCDPGYDVGQLSVGPDVEIYTTLVLKDNSVNFARQALPLTDSEKNIIPVGIDTEKGGEVSFSAYVVPLEDKKFWLEDRVMGIYTNLNAYTYTVTLPANSYGTGRFFIIASTNTPTAIGQPEARASDIRIWTSNDKVIIKGEVGDRAICEVYDVSGKKILDVRLTGGELNTVNLPSGSKGVFIVRIVDGVKVTTRKVAVL